EAAQHVIERDEAVGQNHALHRRMRDVAFVPERNVFESRRGVGSKEPGETANLLTSNGIALVRHRGGSLLALAKRLLYLTNLGFLEASHLQRKLLQGRARDRNGRQELRVPVALDHLRGNRRRLHAQTLTNSGLNGRIEVSVSPDGA